MAGRAMLLRRWNRPFFSSLRRTCGCQIQSLRPFSTGVSKEGREELGQGEVDIPVLIVGAGPVGLCLSLFLTKLGVKCAVIEKNITFSQHPQAHFINNRSMELFSKLDGLADDIQRLQPPVDLWRKFVYCTSLSGTILGSVDHMQSQDFEKVFSPVSVAHFSQYKLTSLLLGKLENLGFNLCTPDGSGMKQEIMLEKRILMGHECTSINPLAECVKVRVSFLIDGNLSERNISCKIVVGSDGAKSMVREFVGVEMKGESALQNLVSVHFLSKDLGQYLHRERPGMLFFIFNSDAIGVLVAHDLIQGEFVLQVPFYPPQQTLEDFSSRVCEGIICKLVGWNLADIQVMDIKPWVMNAEVAEKFVSCNNRVILVGDAAHRFPPAGGFGMNTGIQDAHNLAWKIASLLHGSSSTSILQTYEMERKPIALSNTALSMENFKAAMSIPAALGLDPTVASTVHQAINNSAFSLLPSKVQKAVLEGIFALGRAQVSHPFLNENNPLAVSRLAEVRRILSEGKSLQLQFPSEDLGFRYIEGALVPDLTDKTEDTAEMSKGCRRGSREYVPSSKPGSRLPHMLVRTAKASGEKGIFSTLDLIAGDKLEFLLIIAPKKESYDLAHAAFKVAGKFGILLKICVIWPQSTLHERSEGSKGALKPLHNYIDVEEIRSSWWDICQISREGAILVRPDDHIAWRATSKLDGNLVHEMKRVFSAVLRVDS